MRSFFLFFFFSVSFISCTPTQETILPECTGKSGELIVVINKNYWESSTGISIRKYFEIFQEGLPQNEPIFKLVNISQAAFSGILERHRNILLIDINSKYKKPEAFVRKDVWSSRQIVMEVNAPDSISASALIEKYHDSFITLIQNKEIERIQAYLLKISDKRAIENLKKLHKLELNIPQEYLFSGEGNGFVWYRQETQKPSGGNFHQIIKGIIVAYEDFTTETMLQSDYITSFSDSLTRLYIPGSNQGSFMENVKEFKPIRTEVNMNGNYAIELRGLWHIKGDFMGGPYVSYTTVDQVTNRIVTVKAFLYSPKFDKREYLRELEAICKTLSFKSN